MKLRDFDFSLPKALIAQHPLPERDRSRMMVIWRESGRREHRTFRDLPEILNSEHYLVLNNTRVFPARLRANRPGKTDKIEILLVRELSPGEWFALLKPARKLLPGQELQIGTLKARVAALKESGGRILRFDQTEGLMECFERIGETPLPPYIHRPNKLDLAEDRTRYQTVYARRTGSVAAPTAGLHFTPEVLKHLEERRIGRCEIMLHVGYGTFQPVRSKNVEEHRMEPEYFEVDERAATFIRTNREAGRHLVAIGSTTTRVLEYLAMADPSLTCGKSGYCDLFIYPGFKFRMINGMLTNFHLPRSTLFMLVSAFAGRDLMLDCYQEAISKGYRFFSYGDCMLLI
ncbi:MAG TPA: tRNA preQ1(34) S-adenosylmethionine ribosyltransferase-isomerase QueA [Acidobacteriota bacterium]|nr:tRNA preQ1(34) S-adenosylmethionine ribosyltransferase-isomerase QueA [Acidobacteriota bacterium]